MGRVEAGAAGLALSCVMGTAWGADVCARASDLTALQVAAVQQQLMVAAFACNDVSLYNQFVLTYRDELQSSDLALQAFFVRMDDTGGMAEYHTFKTKMANVYSLRSNADKNGYCRNARASFDTALNGEKRNLASFALAQPIAINEPYTNCGPSIAGAATIAGAKEKTVAAKAEIPAAQALAPDEQVAVMAPPAPTRSPIQKVMPLPAQDPAPSSEEPTPPQDAASGEPQPMIAAVTVEAAAAIPPEPAAAAAPPRQDQPPQVPPEGYANQNGAQQREARPPAVGQAPYAGRNGAPQPRAPQNFTAQRRPPGQGGPPPPYRYGPNYYAGSPYWPRTQYPYSYYYDRYGRLVPYYYRAPYPPAPYRANQYYDDRANGRVLERDPYRREDPDNRAPYRSEGDRAPDDRGFYDDYNRYGTVPPQRY
jgi:hypothetical protein